MSVATFEAEEWDGGWVYLKLEELDAVLGTSKWVVKKRIDWWIVCMWVFYIYDEIYCNGSSLRLR